VQDHDPATPKKNVRETLVTPQAEIDRRAKLGREVAKEILQLPVAEPEEWPDYVKMSMTQLFAETWTLPALSTRDKRLLVLGALTVLGRDNKYAVYIEAALRSGDLTSEQAHEIPQLLAHYVGQPMVSDLVGITDAALARINS